MNFRRIDGKIKVGRIIYSKGGKPIYPSCKGYTPIIVLTKSSPYGDLGPYVLKNEKDQIMENIWQFSKVYPWIPATKQVYSRWDSTIIWDHPKEVHIDEDGTPNDLYWAWREKGMNTQEAIRYPVGSGSHRAKCMYVLTDPKEPDLLGDKLNLVDGRKRVYLKVYTDLAKKSKTFEKLKERLENGENLLIIEVDGPHQESLSYYRSTYPVGEDFIIDNTIDVNIYNMGIMLRDPKHSFGHGYCLATALLEIDKILIGPK
jgi:hypothetical protein